MQPTLAKFFHGREATRQTRPATVIIAEQIWRLLSEYDQLIPDEYAGSPRIGARASEMPGSRPRLFQSGQACSGQAPGPDVAAMVRTSGARRPMTLTRYAFIVAQLSSPASSRTAA